MARSEKIGSRLCSSETSRVPCWRARGSGSAQRAAVLRLLGDGTPPAGVDSRLLMAVLHHNTNPLLADVQLSRSKRSTLTYSAFLLGLTARSFG